MIDTKCDTLEIVRSIKYEKWCKIIGHLPGFAQITALMQPTICPFCGPVPSHVFESQSTIFMKQQNTIFHKVKLTNSAHFSAKLLQTPRGISNQGCVTCRAIDEASRSHCAGRHFRTKLMSQYIGSGQNDGFDVRIQELVSKVKKIGPFWEKTFFRVPHLQGVF